MRYWYTTRGHTLAPGQAALGLPGFAPALVALLQDRIEATWWVVFGFALVIPGIFVLARLCFWAPIVLLEGLSKRLALKRSNQLALRSRSTALLAAAFQLALPSLVEKALRGLITLTTIRGQAFPTKIASELSALNSILVLPLVSIVVALVYLKLRQLGGQDFRELLPRIEMQEGSAEQSPRDLG